MDTENKAFQRLLLVGYLGLMGLFVLIYFLSAYLPASYGQFAQLLQDLSLNLAIALTISFGSYFLLKPLLQNRDRKNLEDFQKAALDLLTLEKGVREAGVVRIYESLADDVLQKRIAEANERVYMFTVWLDASEERLKNMVETLFNNNVSIRILQASSNSGVSKLRADSQKALFPDQSAFEPEFISRITQRNSEFLKTFKNTKGGSLEVREFSVLPPFSLVLIDQSAFIGFYGYGDRIMTFPWIEFRLDENSGNFNYFLSFVLKQFESIWNNSSIVV